MVIQQSIVESLAWSAATGDPSSQELRILPVCHDFKQTQGILSRGKAGKRYPTDEIQGDVRKMEQFVRVKLGIAKVYTATSK